jgi:parallel beta-helix repeat protein
MKRFAILATILLLTLASTSVVRFAWAVPVLYYVDSSIVDTNVASATPDFTTYNPTTFSTTTGSASVFKTIADINALSPAAGDSVLFRKGQTWREQLTVPASGSAGLPITYGAFGSGANPVISGSNIVSGFAAYTGTALQVDANTVALWRFNNDLTDVSGNVRTLVKVAGTTAYAADPYENGLVADAAHYAAVTDVGDYFDFGVGSFTVETVVKYTASSGGIARICYKGTASAPWYSIDRYANGVRVEYLDGTHTASMNYTGINMYTDALWHHVALVVDRVGNTAKLYLDGTERGSTDITAFTAADNASAFTVAATTLGAGILPDAIIAELRVSNIARAAAGFPTSIVGGASNVWTLTLATQPKVVRVNTNRGALKGSVALMTTAYDWFWAANILYLYSVADPATYSAPGIEAGYRNGVVLTNGKSYLTFDGLTVQMANSYAGIFLQGGGTNIIVTNCTAQYNYGAGINVYSDMEFGGISVLRNTVEANESQGINLYIYKPTTLLTGAYVGYNLIFNNYQDGINNRANYSTIEHNIIHDNGLGHGAYQGIQIYTVSAVEAAGAHNIVRYNTIYAQQNGASGGYTENHDGHGIDLDHYTGNNTLYYNVIYGCWGGGIVVFDSNANIVDNNVCYGNLLNHGIQPEISEPEYAEITLDDAAANNCKDNTISNNIGYATVASTTWGAYKQWAFREDAAAVTRGGNTLSNNLFYHSTTGDWYYYDNASGATLATFNAIGGITANLNADPLFASASTADFRLLPASPCINAGVDVSLTADYLGKLVPRSTAPDIGAYEYGGSKLLSLLGVSP